jgi:hypothetical protein
MEARAVGAVVCWVCCEGECGGELLSTGCACRGSSGLAHTQCMITAARHDPLYWTTCSTCKQHFTGQLEVNLAQARWEDVKARPPEDRERLFVCMNFAVTLNESGGDQKGALVLLEEVTRIRRRKLGDDHPDTLDAITNLALLHTEMGCYEEALPLSMEVVASIRQTVGSETEEAAHAIRSLAAVRTLMGDYDLAKPLHEEVLEWRQRVLGNEHLDTLNSMHGLGQCLVLCHEDEKGRALLERTVNIAERVLGKAHPSSKHFSKGLAESKTFKSCWSSNARFLTTLNNMHSGFHIFFHGLFRVLITEVDHATFLRQAFAYLQQLKLQCMFVRVRRPSNSNKFVMGYIECARVFSFVPFYKALKLRLSQVPGEFLESMGAVERSTLYDELKHCDLHTKC